MLTAGDVAIIAPREIIQIEPRDHVIETNILLNVDFVADHVYWQYGSDLTDWLHARDSVERFEDNPVRFLSLDEESAEKLSPKLDELVELSELGVHPARFHRVLSLLFGMLDLLALPIITSDHERRDGGDAYRRTLNPLRAEIRHVVKLLQTSPQKTWTLDDLAGAVHLSVSHLGRLFKSALGRSPMSYLSAVRSARMADLLLSTNDSVTNLARHVGWGDPSYAARVFRRTLGMTPTAYRQQSRRQL